jgi:hypothetical protein
MLNEDYKEMLQCLLEEDVRFLLVGPRVERNASADLRSRNLGSSGVRTLIAGSAFGASYFHPPTGSDTGGWHSRA